MKYLACAVFALLCPLSTRAAQEAPQPEPARKDEITRASEWPKLASDVLATAKIDIERLRRAGTPEMGEQAEAALTAAGPGVVPLLLPVLGKEREPDARERCVVVLDKLTTAEHTRLLAPFFADKSGEVRTWSLRRCARFPDAGVREPADAAYAKAQALLAKNPKLEGGADEVYAAALCATSAGSHAALATLAECALTKWGRCGVELRTALACVRDEESTAFAAQFATDKDRKRIVAGLNLLAGCGTQKALAHVRPHLDSTDNSIRVAAINAMRGIVDGDLPIANLPVFEAIELAGKWKQRTQ